VVSSRLLPQPFQAALVHVDSVRLKLVLFVYTALYQLYSIIIINKIVVALCRIIKLLSSL